MHIQQINAEIQQVLLTRRLPEQKSIVSDSQTIPEATDAFAELTEKIMEDVRKRIDEEIEKRSKLGDSEAEIITHVTKAIEVYQDVTIPQKMEMLATHFNGKLSEVRLQESGANSYIWISMDDEKVRPTHAANDGQIFSLNTPPATGHPGHEHNCRCQAAPIQVAGAGKVVIEIIKQALKKSQGKVKDAAGKIRKNPIKRGEKAPKGGRKDTEWSFDKNKSTTKWENQKKARGWTDKEITEAIKKGDAFPAENFRNNNPATLYKYKDKYVIRDDVTKEIIQIGGKGFGHPSLP